MRLSGGQPTAKTIARAKGWKSTHTYKVSPCESLLALLSKFEQNQVNAGVHAEDTELVNILHQPGLDFDDGGLNMYSDEEM